MQFLHQCQLFCYKWFISATCCVQNEDDIDAAFVNPAAERSLDCTPRPDSAAAATDTYLAKADVIFQVTFDSARHQYCMLTDHSSTYAVTSQDWYARTCSCSHPVNCAVYPNMCLLTPTVCVSAHAHASIEGLDQPGNALSAGTAMVGLDGVCASCHRLATWHACAEGTLEASASIRRVAVNLAEGFCDTRQHRRQANQQENLAMV